MRSKENLIPWIYILSFFIPVIIAALAFFNIQIYPGSANTLLIYDMRNELLPSYGYLSDPGPGYDSLIHTMSGALGGGFLGRIAHDLSFFDIVYIFVSKTSLPDAIYYVTLAKIGFCGLCMSVFLTIKHRKDTNWFIVLILSTCYALMSYTFIYALWPLWMDLIMLLPLLALSVEKIISGKKNPVFVLLLSLGMISDYHITYMVIIALTLYFLFRLIEDGVGFSECKKRILTYIVHGIISAGLSSFMIFPIVNDLMIGKLSAPSDGTVPDLIKNTPIDILKSFMPCNYSTLYYNASPNIFCGSIVVLLALIWFVYGRKELRGRFAGITVLLIYFVSFIFGPLDRAWHGFTDPVGFSVRYSFTFVFFMVCFAARGFNRLRKAEIRISSALRIMVSAVMLLFTIAELFINGSFMLAKLSVDYSYTNKNEYLRYNEFMTKLIDMADADCDGEYYRIYKDFHFSLYDGALYGYDGLLILDSGLNPVFLSFLNSIGIGASPQRMDECGITPPTASLMDFRYFISKSAQSNYYEKIGEFNHHYLYRNDYSLPLVFETAFDPLKEQQTFTDDPFENVNLIYSDFLGENTELFIKQNCVYSTPAPDEYKTEYTAGAVNLFFVPDDEGVFWVYSGYKKTNFGLLSAVDEYGSFVAPIYADLRLNDKEIGSFRDSLYSYCNEIGVLDPSGEVKVSLDTSYSELGNTYIYRYDENALREASRFLSQKGFDITYIGSEGITAEGCMSKDGFAFISLPYNQGYSVYVDGKKAEYTSYRDVFLLVNMDAGKHELYIKFIPSGLRAGIAVSVVFLLIMVLYMGKDLIIIKKSVKHP